MKKLAFMAVTTLAVMGISLSTVFADSPGQLEGGAPVYQVKNLTQGGSYAATISPACGDEIQYSTELHNFNNGGLTSIVVTASLPNGTVTAVPAEGASAGTNGKVTVNLPTNGSLAFENGTTVLYNSSGAVIKTLADTITTSGVNIGDLPGSTTEFVNFKAKVNCAVTPTPTPTPTPAKPAATTPKALPNTGAGDVLGIFAGASTAGTALHMAVSARRNRR
jgi:uncharacterized repeat protein (TIGR01451 family)